MGTMADVKELSGRIREQCRVNGITTIAELRRRVQAVLGRGSRGTGYASINHLYWGKVKQPNWRVVDAIGQVLDVRTEWLRAGETPKERDSVAGVRPSAADVEAIERLLMRTEDRSHAIREEVTALVEVDGPTLQIIDDLVSALGRVGKAGWFDEKGPGWRRSYDIDLDEIRSLARGLTRTLLAPLLALRRAQGRAPSALEASVLLQGQLALIRLLVPKRRDEGYHRRLIDMLSDFSDFFREEGVSPSLP
jgi:hypothetical protein